VGRDKQPDEPGPLSAECQDTVTRYLRSRLRNEHDVCDARQEVFLGLLKNPSPQSIRSLPAYALTVARNTFSALIGRKLTERRGIERLVFEQEGRKSSHPAPDALLEQQEREARLLDCVARLPARQRHYIYHRFICEMSLEEAAKACRITVAAARKTHTRALARLVDLMRRAEGTPPHTRPDSEGDSP